MPARFALISPLRRTASPEGGSLQAAGRCLASVPATQYSIEHKKYIKYIRKRLPRIISTKKGTPQVELDRIVDNFEKQGLSVTLIRGTDYNVFGLVGDTTKIAEKDVLANPWVENVTRVSAPYKRANRLFHPEDTVVDINGVRVGGNAPIAVMAGPCSIEGEEHTIKMAKAVKAGGANFLRGGAYKPRTSPYSFQGLGTEGILDMAGR